MTELQSFLKNFDREMNVLLKVLRNYPADKPDLRPAEKCKTARELAFTFVSEHVLFDGAIKGAIDFTAFPQLEGTIPEIIDRLEKGSKRIAVDLARMSEADWNGEMDFFGGPGKMVRVRRGDVLWSMLYDLIHHRGQYSIYLRMAGAKVPSIYGPTADEPWN